MQKIEQNNTSGRTYGGESAAERLSRQRQTFMDAGLELFGTVGYRATTVRTLCKQAGLTDRYFYKTFSDTEDLLAAVYTESLDQIQAEVVAAINTAANQQLTAGQIDAGLEAFFSAFENSRMARVCWLEVLGVSPRIDALYTHRTQQFAELLLVLGRAMQPNWSIAEEETRITGIALVGAISQSALQWLLDDYRSPRAMLVSANARLIRGLINTLPH
ncbi:TetR/AcrR family transcriptional regulator [Zhongshania aliphaticivorans]|uniref:TetR/AcrR family transcriptional regulator n=1 Tax=Zhongshania aliphaticivorans TaxID=1470434 RepID=UPI0012E42255|nr:TetR/AcrR family transcriptional regulator [Zhongshania aliphaticivorans]CAA0115565.1 HTH-type transcriptional regulator BetI [Zhongshania aliphaticivorans]